MSIGPDSAVTLLITMGDNPERVHTEASFAALGFTRLRHDPRMQAYYERRTWEGKTRREIIRCLKRYAAREVSNLVKTVSSDPLL
ncbi:hypothetical protein M4V62_09505 [Streptomyces durmitorensis]|uniref:Uncharacterized protein n=1 Tax=Streptomyces durmitorensis TaxID=319947 RepID=A0ABY4PQZ3_9ACTN|nr:hypothetical protein [Streptomyces durmitorensis]UQT55314.1 hypothetical protein M4V62_09505 [Streptomyces durmitorensis]